MKSELDGKNDNTEIQKGEYKNTPYFHVAHAYDLKGKDKFLYRILETIPGILAWGTLITVILMSKFLPVWASLFIIVFDLYWLLKTAGISFHHYYNWRRMKHNIEVDWQEMLQNLRYEHVHHMVLLPFYQEGEDVLQTTFDALLKNDYDKEKLIIVLGAEERAGQEYIDLANSFKDKYQNDFGEIIVTVHPADLPGEIKGKGPNISWMAEQARVEILNKKDLDYEDVLVSAFDIDTVVWPKYFSCLTWNFLTTENPLQASFQPVPLYNNNLWEAPVISRVAAMSSTFWQMIQQERPEKLVTFSSHAIPFKVLYEANYWQRNMISDDSRIFWNLYLANDGDYRVVPISYPVSMDANLAPTLFATLKNIYNQHFRWMWGVESLPYILFGFIKNKHIPLRKKIKQAIIQLEGFWSLATNPVMILILGWLPIFLGGDAFRDTVLSYNLPKFTSILMNIALMGLILSAVISLTLLPPMPAEYKRKFWRKFVMVIQWILVPFTILVFGSLPGLHAQTRLMLGKYVGQFWVTPKHRKK
jgi:hypothetical protein